MRTKQNDTISLSELSAACGSSRESVKKWLVEAGTPFTETKAGLRYDRDRALACIAEHKRASADAAQDSPWRRKALAEAKKIERENRIAEMLEKRTYMLASDVYDMMAKGIARLELVPVKLASEFALDPKVTKRLEALWDEARREFARGITESDEKENEHENTTGN